MYENLPNGKQGVRFGVFEVSMYFYQTAHQKLTKRHTLFPIVCIEPAVRFFFQVINLPPEQAPNNQSCTPNQNGGHSCYMTKCIENESALATFRFSMTSISMVCRQVDFSRHQLSLLTQPNLTQPNPAAFKELIEKIRKKQVFNSPPPTPPKLISSSQSLNGERGGSVVECRTPEREVRGSRPTSAVLCPWARHFTPRKYWLITQEAMAPSRHDWKIVEWDVKPQHNKSLNL